jgi:hypothetical protein
LYLPIEIPALKPAETATDKAYAISSGCFRGNIGRYRGAFDLNFKAFSKNKGNERNNCSSGSN